MRLAVEALEEMDLVGKVQLIVSGGIRSGADVAKLLGYKILREAGAAFRRCVLNAHAVRARLTDATAADRHPESPTSTCSMCVLYTHFSYI